MADHKQEELKKRQGECNLKTGDLVLGFFSPTEWRDRRSVENQLGSARPMVPRVVDLLLRADPGIVQPVVVRASMAPFTVAGKQRLPPYIPSGKCLRVDTLDIGPDGAIHLNATGGIAEHPYFAHFLVGATVMLQADSDVAKHHYADLFCAIVDDPERVCYIGRCASELRALPELARISRLPGQGRIACARGDRCLLYLPEEQVRKGQVATSEWRRVGPILPVPIADIEARVTNPAAVFITLTNGMTVLADCRGIESTGEFQILATTKIALPGLRVRGFAERDVAVVEAFKQVDGFDMGTHLVSAAFLAQALGEHFEPHFLPA